MRYDCLIVDDEEALSQSTAEYFNMFSVQTAWVASADACLRFLRENETRLILLDINLGSQSGLALCKTLRKTTSVPILFISARQSDDDMILALSIGGDDYVQKPYSLSVLLAKVKAVLKRCAATGGGTGGEGKEKRCFGKLCIDFAKETVTIGGEKVPLKTMEYKLLVYLAQHSEQVVPKEELFQKVWADAITGDNTLNVHIRRLREKIEEDPNEPEYIKTVWGRGYMFSAGAGGDAP